MSKDLTVAQLERLLAKKKAKLQKLEVQRDRLRKKLAGVEQNLSALGGVHKEGVRRRRKGHKRFKNAQTLFQAVCDVLGQNKKGLSVKALADKVLATGYKTASDNFPNTVYQCLYANMPKLAHDDDAHTYRLK